MYIYDAISRLSPLVRAFAKKGTKPKPHPYEPYPINKRLEKQAEVNKEKAISQNGLRYMQQLMAQSELYFEGRK